MMAMSDRAAQPAQLVGHRGGPAVCREWLQTGLPAGRQQPGDISGR